MKFLQLNGKKITLNNKLIVVPTESRFIITIDTRITGGTGSASDTMVIPTTDDGYDCSIDWGDSTSSTHSGTPGNISHQYPAPGTYQIKILGTFPQIYFNNAGDKLKVIDIDFGLNVFRSLIFAFYGCANLVSTGTSKIQVINNSVPSCRSAFNGCTSLVSVTEGLFDNILNITTSYGFNATFQSCTNLATIPALIFAKLQTWGNYVFYSTFNQCLKLQLNRNIFYADEDKGTRFLNKSVYFYSCFRRTSFSGSQGTAPDLWNCNFGTGTATKTDCFNGTGNSLTSISNYNDIPEDWK
jgi:hypothetical protein